MRITMSLAALALSLTLAATAAAPSPIAASVPARKEPVSFAKEIADLLDAKCVGCHGNALAKNTLNLGDLAGMLKGASAGRRSSRARPTRACSSGWPRTASSRSCPQRNHVEPVMPSAEKKEAHGLRLVATCPLAALTYLILRVCSGDEV